MDPNNQNADLFAAQTTAGDATSAAHSAATHSTTSGASASASDSTSLLDQAKQVLGQGNMTDLLGQVQLPASVKDLGTKAVTSFNKLSTTQKLIGGGLLLLGVGVLARGGKSGKAGKSGRQGEQIDTLNELLYFVNDRIEGYKKAVQESQDAQLRNYYQQLVRESQQFSQQLNSELTRLGGQRQTSTTLKGKIYRRFMEAASGLTGHDEQAILASNVHGEQWAIKAYKEALAGDALRGHVRQMVERQYDESERTYERLKQLTKQHETA
jgi:uncharacterized protein (TIGR02284 family)